MDERQFKPFAKEFLGHYGLQVKDVLADNEALVPDFEVFGRADKYVIELKIKGDDSEKVAEETERLSKGEIVGKLIPIGPRNTLAGIIRNGVEQMVAFNSGEDSFRVIWLHSAGRDPNLHYIRIKSTLFGTEKLVSLRKTNVITCYYFHESAFFAWRDYLDGALLTYVKNSIDINAQLCINSLSPRADLFRESELATALKDGLCDPNKLAESDDHVMIADCDIDRKKTDKLLRFLQKKYGLDHLQAIQMKQITAIAAIPKK